MVNRSTKTRHSYVQFYPSDWLAGTARMPRLVKSVYFDICLYNWDKAEAVPESEVMLMLADLEVQGDAIVDALVKSKKLFRDDEGAVYCQRAIDEAERALGLWTAKSKGGKNKPESRENDRQKPATIIEESSQESLNDSPTEPEPEPEPEQKKEIISIISKENDDDRISLVQSMKAQIEGIVEAWNEMAVQYGLRQVVKLTREREIAIRQLISDFGVERLTAGIKDIGKAPYLTGANDRKWKASFDWVLKGGTALRLIEGDYHTDALQRLAWPYIKEAARVSQAKRDEMEKQAEKVWTQEEIDETNRTFEKLGIETRYELVDGKCVSWVNTSRPVEAEPRETAEFDN
jgi:hypothetical protein